jgi:hypothetical protein
LLQRGCGRRQIRHSFCHIRALVRLIVRKQTSPVNIDILSCAAVVLVGPHERTLLFDLRDPPLFLLMTGTREASCTASWAVQALAHRVRSSPVLSSPKTRSRNAVASATRCTTRLRLAIAAPRGLALCDASGAKCNHDDFLSGRLVSGWHRE